MFRQLTPTEPLRSRRDPELFITAAGPQIYFNRIDRSIPGPNGNNGIYRTDTGLGPTLFGQQSGSMR
jgi:hypothetical protein